MVDKALLSEIQKLKAEHNITTWQAYLHCKLESAYSDIAERLHTAYPQLPQKELLIVAWRGPPGDLTPAALEPEKDVMVFGKREPERPSVELYLCKTEAYTASYARKALKLGQHPTPEKVSAIYELELSLAQLRRIADLAEERGVSPAYFVDGLRYKAEVNRVLEIEIDVNADEEIEDIETSLEGDNREWERVRETYTVRNLGEKFLRFKRERVLHKWEYQRILLEDYMHSYVLGRSIYDYDKLVEDAKRRLLDDKKRHELFKQDPIPPEYVPGIDSGLDDFLKFDVPDVRANQNNRVDMQQYFLHALIKEENWVRRRLRDLVSSKGENNKR